MCLRRFAILLSLVGLFVGGCCVEGLPVLHTDDVSVDKLPTHVRQAFETKYRADEVSQVEHRWFKSVCAEDSSYYVFHLRDGATVHVDDKGRTARVRE